MTMRKIYEKPLTLCEEAMQEVDILGLSPMGEGGVWGQSGVDPNDPSDGTDEEGSGNYTLIWDRMDDHL